TRLAILRMKAQNQPVVLPDDVLELIGSHIKDNIRELEGALIRLCAYASIHKVEVTRQLGQEVLSDVITATPPRQVTPKAILEAVSESFGISIADILGPSRRRPLVTARQVAMYLFRSLLQDNASFPSIGESFDRDHTTVIHAVEKIAHLMQERTGLYNVVEELIHKLREDA
ncbi:MAG TPA: helix-turn-helix domain-containing protein, partial [Acidimicrobiales bacterium]|nr:helix-turn-helix domain-containing protein [Acidimicrobiales bacterium]